MPKKKVKMTKSEIKAMKAMKIKLANIKAIKDEMEREHKMTSENLPKVINIHYPRMKEASLSNMKTDLKVMQQISNRVFDLKNYIIRSLNEDKHYAEEAYKLQTMTHMGHADNLLELMQSRLATLAQIYDKEKIDLIDKYHSMQERLKEDFKNREEVLKLATLINIRTHKEREAEEYGEFTLKFDELQERLQINHDKMEGTYESTLKKMWGSLQKFFLEYQQKTAEPRKLYEHYLQLENDNCKCIRYQANWISSHGAQAQRLKEKLKKYEEKYNIEVEDLKKKRQKYIDLYKQQLNRLQFEEKSDFKRLQVLVHHSNETENKLKTIVSKAEKILTLAQMCRALETENEKIAVSTEDCGDFQDLKTKENNTNQSEKSRNNLQTIESINLPDEFLISNIETMEHFWERVASANMHRAALGIEKENLVQEHLKLKSKLKEVFLLLGRHNINKNDIGKIKITRQQIPEITILKKSLINKKCISTYNDCKRIH